VIKQLSKGVFQTFISTHSTVFVDRSQLDTIRKVQLEDKYTSISICSSVTDVHESLGIKNSDLLFYDVFIAGEGDSEEILIPHFYQLYFGRSIEEDSIQIINLGGESKWRERKELFEQILRDYKSPDECLFCVLDKDTNLDEKNIYLVGDYDIEDSISNKYWIQLLRDKCGLEFAAVDLKIIRDQMTSNKDKKFHKLLRDKVAEESKRTDYLPSKKNCAHYMREYIKDKKAIPEGIAKLFKDLET